jgi:hypothetical protein
VHRRESSAETGAAPLRRRREPDLSEKRFEVVARGRHAGEDPRSRLSDPRVRPRKSAHLPTGAEEPLPRLVRLGREFLK